jgi:hypothetical protein
MSALNTERIILDNLPAEIEELELDLKDAITKVYTIAAHLARLRIHHELAQLSVTGAPNEVDSAEE